MQQNIPKRINWQEKDKCWISDREGACTKPGWAAVCWRWVLRCYQGLGNCVRCMAPPVQCDGSVTGRVICGIFMKCPGWKRPWKLLKAKHSSKRGAENNNVISFSEGSLGFALSARIRQSPQSLVWGVLGGVHLKKERGSAKARGETLQKAWLLCNLYAQVGAWAVLGGYLDGGQQRKDLAAASK